MNVGTIHQCANGAANLLRAIRSIIWLMAVLGLVGLSHNASAQTFTADWTNLGTGSIGAVTTGSSITAGPRTVTINHSTITNGGPFTNFYGPGPEMLTYWNGTLGTQTGSLLYTMDNSSFDSNDRFQTIYAFSGTVSNLTFSVAHLDRGGSHHDAVTIEYRNGGGAWLNIRSTPSFFTTGAVVGTTTLSGVQGFHGTGGAGGLTSTTGNINVNFGATSVTEVRITYHFGQSVGGDPSGNLQYMGLSDFTFQVPGVLVSDLSLSKSVSNTTPATGTAINYTLNVTNASGSAAESNVQVRDLLPTGVTFNSATGYGSYDAVTGIWTVPAIAANQTRSITINATITAPNGTSITNYAEVFSQTNFDTDSTPNNNSATEDDDATASFTTTGTRTAGIAPNLAATCSIANQIVFDWDSNPWTSGSLSNSYAMAGIGTMDIDIALTGGSFVNDASFGGLSPSLANANNGGFAGTQLSLHQYIDFFDRNGTSTMTVDLPTAVPGLQFTIFDIDFAANDFADKVTVTGTYNGTPVIPILTNGIANYVVGNTAVGDAGSGGTAGDGNVVVTFSSPVDTVTIIYGNAATAPANPDGQAAAWFDMTFCAPETTLSVTKVSQVVSDPVNGSTDPKAIPGAIMQYCILISNAGSASAEAITATDTIPANVTYNAASMQSGSNCGSTSTVEDDDATGADESDPFGASVSGPNIVATAPSLGPAEAYALTFQVTVD